MRNNRLKKRIVSTNLCLLFSLVVMFCFFVFQISRESFKIEANSTDELVPSKHGISETIIHKDKDYAYTVPKDASGKIEPDMSDEFVQNSGFKPNFTKGLVDLTSYSSASNDFLFRGATPKTGGTIHNSLDLRDGTRLIILQSRNDMAVNNWGAPWITFGIIFRVKNDGTILDQLSIASGGIYPSGNNQTTTAIGEHATAVSKITEANGVYSVRYMGQAPGDFEYMHRELSFKAEPHTNKISNCVWTRVSLPENSFGIDIEYGLIGTNKPLAYGVSAAQSSPTFDNADTLQTYLYNHESKSYSHEKAFHVPNYNSMIASPDGTDIIWLYNLGINKDGGYYGRVRYSSFKAFETSFRDIFVFWDEDGKYLSHEGNNANQNIHVLTEISDKEVVYYWRDDGEFTKIYKANLETQKVESIMAYPTGTVLEISHNQNKTSKYILNGYATRAEGQFLGYFTKPSSIIAYLNEKFEVINVGALETNGQIVFSEFLDSGKGHYFVNGSMRATDFTSNPEGDWKVKTNENDYNAFWGELLNIEDFRPGIKFSSKKLMVNIDEKELNWDRKILEDVAVVDKYDFIHSKKSQSWLNNRINRNPLDPNINETDNTKRMPIDWLALGLTKTEAGPQRIKYFITDSSMQTTASSRWINKVTNQTVQENEYALDAQNFSIELDEVEAALNTEEDFKKRAKTMAWNSDSHEIDEDSVKDVFSEEKVTINQAQLKELRQAKIAKPYPVDVTYRPNDKTTLVNRVWVFVTGPTTIVDSNYVMYLDNYRLPLHEVVTEDVEKIYTHSKVKVYKYNDAESEIDDEPALQADKTTPELLEVKAEEMQALQQATSENADREDAFSLTITFKDKEGKQVQGISQVTVYHGKANLEIRFTDEDGSELHQAINREEAVDSALDLTQLNDIREATTAILSEGYELIEKPENETQFMLPKDGKTVTYIFKGNVTLKSVTKNMYFTTGKVSPFAQSLSYDGTDKFKLSVTDQRGQKAPKEGYKRGQFSIQATLNQPFSKESTKHLKGAALIYEDGTATYEITSAGTEIYKSNQSQETKTYELMLDDKSNPNKGLRLYVPKGSNTETGTYTAEVTWELVEGP